MSAAERIAEALEEHDRAYVWGGRVQCRCDAEVSPGDAGLARHQAEVVLGLPGIADAEAIILRIRRYIARESFSQGGLPTDVVDAEHISLLLDGKEPR